MKEINLILEGQDIDKVLLEETEYQKFFKKKLDQWKVKSPSQLSDEDRKKFFSEIEKEWDKDDK